VASVIIVGIVAGSAYALAGMGLVVTYRASGIFNFAQGAMGMFMAFVYWQCTIDWGWPMVLGLLVSLGVVAPLVGVVSEWVFRPLRDAAVSVQIVVSLGMLVFLQNLGLTLFGDAPARLPSIFPDSQAFRLASVNVGWDQVGTVVVALALAGVLSWVLYRTPLGVSMRAVVDSEETAELAGISAVKVSRAAWIIGVTFAGAGGILLAPVVGLDVNLLTLLVITAYAAAMLGKLESLALTYVGGVLLALGENATSYWAPPGGIWIGLRGSLAFILLVTLLVLYRRQLPRERKVLDRTADAYEREPLTARVRLGLLAAGAAIAVAIAWIVSDQFLYDLTQLVVVATILLSLVVLTGFSGQISLGQASFVGIGAFTASHVANTDGSIWLALLVAAAIAAPVGVVVGLSSLRLSGLFLALATMAFALLMDNLVFRIHEISGGVDGREVRRPDLPGVDLTTTRSFYFFTLVVFAVFAGLVVALRRSRFGRRFQALRDSPDALRTLGVNLAATRLGVFALSATMASVAGVVFGSYRGRVNPLDFNLLKSIEFLVAAVVGGIATVAGAVIGGLIVAVPQLAKATPETATRFQLAVGLIVVVLARYPQGLLSFGRQVVEHANEVLAPSSLQDREGGAAVRPAADGEVSGADLRELVADEELTLR